MCCQTGDLNALPGDCDSLSGIEERGQASGDEIVDGRADDAQVRDAGVPFVILCLSLCTAV